MEMERNYKELLTQYSELQKYDKDKLRDVLPSVSQDGALSGLLDKLHEAQQNYATLTNDYMPADVHVARVKSMIDELNQQINDRVDGIMAGMDSMVTSKKAALDELTSRVEAARQKDKDDAVKTAPYWEAKRQMISMLEFHKLLAAKIESEKLDLEIPKTPKEGKWQARQVRFGQVH